MSKCSIEDVSKDWERKKSRGTFLLNMVGQSYSDLWRQSSYDDKPSFTLPDKDNETHRVTSGTIVIPEELQDAMVDAYLSVIKLSNPRFNELSMLKHPKLKMRKMADDNEHLCLAWRGQMRIPVKAINALGVVDNSDVTQEQIQTLCDAGAKVSVMVSIMASPSGSDMKSYVNLLAIQYQGQGTFYGSTQGGYSDSYFEEHFSTGSTEGMQEVEDSIEDTPSADAKPALNVPKLKSKPDLDLTDDLDDDIPF